MHSCITVQQVCRDTFHLLFSFPSLSVITNRQHTQHLVTDSQMALLSCPGQPVCLRSDEPRLFHRWQAILNDCATNKRPHYRTFSKTKDTHPNLSTYLLPPDKFPTSTFNIFSNTPNSHPTPPRLSDQPEHLSSTPSPAYPVHPPCAFAASTDVWRVYSSSHYRLRSLQRR